MKKLNLILVFAMTTVFAFSQSTDITYVDVTNSSKKVSPINKQPFHTNAKVVLNEISISLHENIAMPAICQEFYNDDVTVIAAFTVTQNGHLENIIVGNGEHKILEREIEKELNKLDRVSPVLENGMPVKRNFKLPVVFKI